RVDPAAMAVVADHDRRHHGVVLGADQEPLASHRSLAVDVLARIVPRTREAGGLPQGDDGGFVGIEEGANLHGGLGGVGVPSYSGRRFLSLSPREAPPRSPEPR